MIRYSCFSIASVVLLLLIPVSSTENITQSDDLDFEACTGAAHMSALELELEARVVAQLGLDRSPIGLCSQPVFRILVEPASWAGKDSQGQEWTIAIYLPDEGNAIVEKAAARKCIRAINSLYETVSTEPLTLRVQLRSPAVLANVDFARAEISREVAEQIQGHFWHLIARTRVVSDRSDVIRLHSTEYTVMVWKQDWGTRCVSAGAHETEFQASILGKLTSLLASIIGSQGETSDLESRISNLLKSPLEQ